MQFSTTTLTLFLTTLASLSTTQARIGQTPSTDNRMMLEDICSAITVDYVCTGKLEGEGAYCRWDYSSDLGRDACMSSLDNGCPNYDIPIDETSKHTCPTGRTRCYNSDAGGYCYPRITEEWCNQTCRDYCTDEVPRWVMSVEDCMTNGIDLGTCMYPEGLDLPFPCSDNADD